jgi:uroporphyrinogen III methyltransferase / synthase
MGTVYLVGAGPGDPKLITVRGMELLRQADVVVYDRLAHPSLLDHARPDAERIYVGKASAQHAMKQPDINALLVEKAQQGKMVVRLKGGDPFVFGRGGEEAEVCREKGILFEIVPGITSAIAAPAYAGIPVTHRDAASSFAVVTGHERDDASEHSGERQKATGESPTPEHQPPTTNHQPPGQAEQRRDWSKLAHAADTLVFLMGVEALPEITARLTEHGRSPETPVALVQWGTWTRQRVVTGTLATIADEVKRAGLTPPAVCVVGEVVKLRDTLRWFDDPATRPLFGKRILVTRAREQASALSDLLRSRGAEPIEFPAIRIECLSDNSALDDALNTLSQYAWVVFTSVNAVTVFAERLDILGFDARIFGTTKIAAIGPATATALRQHLHLRADFVPSEAVAESVLAEWPDLELTDKRILLPRAKEAREILPDKLTERGATVDVIPVYETVLDDTDAETLRDQLQSGKLDILTFTSSSTVRNFAQALIGDDTSSLPALVGDTLITAIGPITADTIREFGLTPHIIADNHTIPGLVAALELHVKQQEEPE